MHEIQVYCDTHEHFKMSLARVPVKGDFLIAKGKRFIVTEVYFYETMGIDVQVEER